MMKFLSIKDKGVINDERVVFRVVESGNIGSQMVLCTRSVKKTDGERQLTARVYAAYWFLDRDVQVDDLIVLYTKESSPIYKIKHDEVTDATTHFFYWRRNETVWDKEEVALVTSTIAEWETHHI